MRHTYLLTVGLCLLALSLNPADALPKGALVISTGKVVTLTDRLMPEKPTVFVFMKPSSTLERAFLDTLSKDAGKKVGIRVIELKTGMEPIAAKHEIKETPTALVYDRRGRLVARSSQPEEIQAAIKKAAGVMRIDWAEEGDANFEGAVKALGRSPGTGILRTMTLQPEYLKYINDLSMKAHFSDGYLPRRVKEMIATHVSALNKCKY
jgi:hypothetical protein